MFTTTEFQEQIRLDGDRTPFISDMQVEADGIGKLLGELLQIKPVALMPSQTEC